MIEPRWIRDGYRWALIALAIACLPLTTLRLYSTDEIQNFAYLRSIVFDRDLDFTNEYQWFVDRDPAGYAGFARGFLDRRTPAGRVPDNAPIGSAILWAPFYLLAVGLAYVVGAASSPGGYSRIAIGSVCYASALYGLLGLLLTQEICRQFASRAASFWASVLMFTATNLLFYVLVTPPMSHAGSFFAVALFLWWWLVRTREGRGGWALGLLGGLMVSVRWQDLLFLAVPVAGAGAAGEVTTARRIRRWLQWCAAIGIGAAVAVVPQLVVWKVLNGSFAPYTTVRPVGERFSPFAPHLAEIFVSPFHGLFVWSPVLIAAFAGLVGLARTATHGRALVLGLSLQVYLLACYSHAFGHGFGQRLFVSSLPIAAVGLAISIDWLRPRIRSGPAAALAALCVWWNLSLMAQYGTGMIPRDRGVPMPTLLRNQFVEVPRRVPTLLVRYLLARSSLFETDPQRPPRADGGS